MKGLSLGASVAGGLSAFCGFYFSYRFDLPLGPLVVMTLCALFGLSSLARLALKRS